MWPSVHDSCEFPDRTSGKVQNFFTGIPCDASGVGLTLSLSLSGFFWYLNGFLSSADFQKASQGSGTSTSKWGWELNGVAAMHRWESGMLDE